MPGVPTELIFQALFGLASTVQGASWDGSPIPLRYQTRNWTKPYDVDDSILPALYQLDPLPEKDLRTGLGRSKRFLHAQISILMQRQQPDQYSDAQPFATIVNNWISNLYDLFSPADGGPQTLTALPDGEPFEGALAPGFVTDCYPIGNRPDMGADASRVTVVYFMIEIERGG